MPSWTALANEGMGATLQHYGQFGPANAEALAKFLDIPASWKSTGLMVSSAEPSPLTLQATWLTLYSPSVLPPRALPSPRRLSSPSLSVSRSSLKHRTIYEIVDAV